MRKALSLVAGLAVFAFAGAGAAAQPSTSPAPGTPPKLVKLPNGDYTIDLHDLTSAGMSGRMTLHPEGLKTLVVVRVIGGRPHMHVFDLEAGRDCSRLGVAAMPLTPAQTGSASQTIVALPIDHLSGGDYLLRVRDASASS